jgi:tetratricopeptide (TPR) repeat protein
MNYKLGRYADAIEDLNKVVSLMPEDPMSFHNRGVMRANTGRQEEAIDDYSKAIKLYGKVEGISKKVSMTYHYRGLAHQKLGQYDAAKKDFQKALVLDPSRKTAYERMRETDTALKDMILEGL